MVAMTEIDDVKVKVDSFSTLFATSDLKLSLDSYQRPFVWTETKINQMIGDLHTYLTERQQDATLDYYMGTVLLHRDDKAQRYFIIDGQQRLTSLCVLYHVVIGKLPPKCDLQFRSPESVRNIHQARTCFERNRSQLAVDALFENIVFTVITVPVEDLAFTFFDTQNHRGVPLGATDLLKAHHLRAIRNRNGSDEPLQLYCAQHWETLQGKQANLRANADFARTLFDLFLWRARRWTGQKQIVHEAHDSVLEEFQERAVPVDPEAPGTVHLYAAHSNRFGSSLTLAPDQGYKITPQARPNGSPAAVELPFSIRQPVHAGVGFFLYAEKYAELYEQLQATDAVDPEIRAFARFNRDVVSVLSIYLRELFMLAAVTYVDQFGTDRLFTFALWLDYVLGAIRLEKAYIFRAAPRLFLCESDRNLLDVIAMAYRPDDVIAWLRANEYAQESYAKEPRERGKGGVQDQYIQRVLTYYAKSNSLKDRALWITDEFMQSKKQGAR